MEPDESKLPAEIAAALGPIPAALAPGILKGLNRLLGAAVEWPAAWLAQKAAKINAQTDSYRLVEAAIAASAASKAGADLEIADRAMHVLVHQGYRKQINREAVAKAMVEDMREHVVSAAGIIPPPPDKEIDEDWLNIFERYAEDASSERLQGLWGRVLAGEVRAPGRFSTRTLRFLSEFSQADALTFEYFAKCAFGDAAPKQLAIPPDRGDIRDLIYLEANGIIQGVSGLGLSRTLKLDGHGFGLIGEGELRLVLKGEPNSTFAHDVIALTPLGQELLGLVASRDPREAARAVALSLRNEHIHEAYLGVRDRVGGKLHMMEMLWVKEDPAAPAVEGTTG